MTYVIFIRYAILSSCPNIGNYILQNSVHVAAHPYLKLDAGLANRSWTMLEKYQILAFSIMLRYRIEL